MSDKLPWKDAPEWADWRAMDEDGQWKWYENKPYQSTIYKGFWAPDGGREAWAGMTYWFETLEQRGKRDED